VRLVYASSFSSYGASYDVVGCNNSNFIRTFLNWFIAFTIRSQSAMQCCLMNAIESVKSDLKPRLEELLLHLNETGQIAATAFFTKIFIDLDAVDGEEQLLELFIELSTTAFLGIPFDEVALALIDDVLMNAEQVAQTFSVDDSTPQ
jgi:hypothetical protein